MRQVKQNNTKEEYFDEEKTTQKNENDFSFNDYVCVSDIYEQIESERFMPGLLNGVVIDVSGIQGGTLTRLHNALKIGGRVVVPKKLYEEYRNVIKVYYGDLEEEDEFYVVTKRN